jgi:type VI secretion system protein ImpC
VSNTETSDMLKIRVLNVSKKELVRDLQRAVEFDLSAIFAKVYEEEYGTFGGSPYGVMIGDYEFGWHPQDIELLEKMSNVAAVAHAPFIAAASPAMFNWENFTELTGPRDLYRIFDSDQYLRWKYFRETEDARYVGLALPHVLMRVPYGSEGTPVEEFRYEENVDGREHTKYLWGNGAYAFAVRLTSAFSQYEWCAAIHGVEGGGLIGGLPVHTYRTDEGDIALKCPTEIPITDRREAELSRLGFMPLCHAKGTDKAVFFTVASCHRPRKYLDDGANANAGLAAQFDYVMAVSRFAHFLKAMMRDKIGSFKSRLECEQHLNNWISQYVLLDDTAGQETRAKFPLREARIEVVEVPGKPGTFRAVGHMRPQFQLDEITVPMRAKIALPQSRA